MLKLIKNHHYAVLLAIIIGFLSFFPQVYGVLSMGDDFQGVYPLVCCTDETYYLTRAHDVIDGHGNLGNPFIFEYKNIPALQFWIPDYLMAKSSVIVGGDIHKMFITYDLIFPIILTILTYSITFLLTRDKILSLSTAALLHLGLFLNIFTRSPSPQFNFIFFLSLLFFLIRYLQGRDKKWIILSTLNLGLLFHFYTYYWTYFFVLLPIFVFLSIIFLKKELSIKPFIYSILGALVIAIPYFVQLYRSSQLPFYEETLFRMGMLNNHFPSGTLIVFGGGILTLLLLFLLWRKIISINPVSVFIFSAVISTIIAVNHHIITGKYLEFSSHYRNLSIFIFIFTSAYIVSALLNRFDFKFKKFVPILIFISVFIFSLPHVAFTINRQSTVEKLEYDWQRYGGVFNWLNENTPRDSVVYGNREFSKLVSAYTHNNVFYSDSVLLHFMPSDEIIDRFVISNYFNNDFKDLPNEFFLKNERRIWGISYVNRFLKQQSENRIRNLIGLDVVEVERLPQEEIKKVRDRYTEISDMSFKENLSPYKVDYLIWDSREDSKWRLPKGSLKEVNKVGEFVIYEII